MEAPLTETGENRVCTAGPVSKGNCSWTQVLSLEGLEDAGSTGRKGSVLTVPSSHPVRGTGVGNMNTHGYSERIIKAGL